MRIIFKLWKIFFFMFFFGTEAIPAVKDDQSGTNLTTKNDHLIVTDNIGITKICLFK